MNNSLLKIINSTSVDQFKALLAAVGGTAHSARDITSKPGYLSLLDVPEFSAEQLASTNWCDYSEFSDAEYLRGLSVIPNVQTHYALYGKTQGRAVLEKLEKTNVSKVALIAPSYGKQCGIGEYGRYLESSFKAIGKTAVTYRTSAELVSQSDEVVKDSLILVNHGPGLFDGFNPKLGQGESTKNLLQNLISLRDRGALPLVLMHSLIDTDHELLFSRQQMLLNSEIPTVTFITDASRHFYIPQVELGVSPVKKPKEPRRKLAERSERQEVVGFFGFFQYGGKDFDALFHLVRSIRAKLAGSVATSNADELKRFTDLLDDTDIHHDLGSGWVTDKELAKRLLKADYFYLPQNDYDHWNNSATARFVMNLSRPVFLPPHQPFLDVEEGAVFATTEDLPRVVSFFREEVNYAEAVEKASKFREKADMKNTASKLLNGVFNEFKSNSTENIISSNDTSLQRFMGLKEEEKARYLETKGAPSEYSIENAIELTNSGVFSSLYKSVDRNKYWRKHYNLDDFVQKTLLESVHTMFQSICKRPVNIKELAGICKPVSESAPGSSGDILSNALKTALSNNSQNQFQNIKVAIYHNGVPLSEDDISPEVFDRLIEKSAQNTAVISNLELESVSYKPYINNVLEMLVQPESRIDEREYSIDLSKIDMQAVLSQESLYERYNLFIQFCASAGINIAEKAIVDKPLVRDIEHLRVSYEAEDLFIFNDDHFVLNAIRSLFKREPFPIELLALRNMLDTLGKVDVLNHLRESRCCRAELVDVYSDQCALIENEFDRFSEIMRDPVSGGIDLRNKYVVKQRHNYRCWLATESVKNEYLEVVGGELPSLLSVYYRLCSAEKVFGEIESSHSSGQIENWLTVGGIFINTDATVKAMPSLSADTPLLTTQGCSIGKNSLINFEEPEKDGIWTNSESAYLMFKIDDEEGKEEDIYTVSVRLRTYGSKKIPNREIQLCAFGNISSIRPTVINAVVNDDSSKLFSLPLKDVVNSNYYVLQFNITATANPHSLGDSEDNRDLGVMVEKIELHRTTSESTIRIEERVENG